MSLASPTRAWQCGQGLLEYDLSIFLIAVGARSGIVLELPLLVPDLSGALPAR